MIDKQQIIDLVTEAIANTDAFLVEVTVSRDNDIVVEIDSPTGIDLDFTAEVSRKLNEAMDREKEDYSLEVGSASLSAPFKVKEQYIKHIGDTVDVFTKAGSKLTGVLTAVSPDGEEFTLDITRKVKAPGEKRPKLVTEPETLRTADCRQVTYHFDFK